MGNVSYRPDPVDPDVVIRNCDIIESANSENHRESLEAEAECYDENVDTYQTAANTTTGTTPDDFARRTRLEAKAEEYADKANGVRAARETLRTLDSDDPIMKRDKTAMCAPLTEEELEGLTPEEQEKFKADVKDIQDRVCENRTY